MSDSVCPACQQPFDPDLQFSSCEKDEHRPWCNTCHGQAIEDQDCEFYSYLKDGTRTMSMKAALLQHLYGMVQAYIQHPISKGGLPRWPRFPSPWIPHCPRELRRLGAIFVGDLNRKLLPLVQDVVKQIIDSKDASDGAFLARLSTKRDWKSGCAICQTETIMGTTCACGHTEIVVFRPCGHAICANPCFETFMSTHQTTLDTQVVETTNGKRFRVLGKKNVNLDTHFSCPLCRETVTHTFRAEDIHVKIPQDYQLINMFYEKHRDYSYP